MWSSPVMMYLHARASAKGEEENIRERAREADTPRDAQADRETGRQGDGEPVRGDAASRRLVRRIGVADDLRPLERGHHRAPGGKLPSLSLCVWLAGWLPPLCLSLCVCVGSALSPPARTAQTGGRRMNSRTAQSPFPIPHRLECASSAEFTLLPSWRPHAHKESLQPKERAEGGAPQSLP